MGSSFGLGASRAAVSTAPAQSEMTAVLPAPEQDQDADCCVICQEELAGEGSGTKSLLATAAMLPNCFACTPAHHEQFHKACLQKALLAKPHCPICRQPGVPEPMSDR